MGSLHPACCRSTLCGYHRWNRPFGRFHREPQFGCRWLVCRSAASRHPRYPGRGSNALHLDDRGHLSSSWSTGRPSKRLPNQQAKNCSVHRDLGNHGCIERYRGHDLSGYASTGPKQLGAWRTLEHRRYRTACFNHGCFSHGHRRNRGSVPTQEQVWSLHLLTRFKRFRNSRCWY